MNEEDDALNHTVQDVGENFEPARRVSNLEGCALSVRKSVTNSLCDGHFYPRRISSALLLATCAGSTTEERHYE